MSTKDAIVKTVGKEKYNSFIEAGVSDVSILEHACLTDFLNLAPTAQTVCLRTALALIWDKPPGTFKLNLDIAS